MVLNRILIICFIKVIGNPSLLCLHHLSRKTHDVSVPPCGYRLVCKTDRKDPRGWKEGLLSSEHLLHPRQRADAPIFKVNQK